MNTRSVNTPRLTETSTRAELPPLLVNPRQAARMLAIGTRKLWELTNRREIPCVRIGRAVRYSPADLQAWLDRQRGVQQ